MVSTFIIKVRKNKSNNQKWITIPKDCEFDEGDYVKLTKVE